MLHITLYNLSPNRAAPVNFSALSTFLQFLSFYQCTMRTYKDTKQKFKCSLPLIMWKEDDCETPYTHIYVCVCMYVYIVKLHVHTCIYMSVYIYTINIHIIYIHIIYIYVFSPQFGALILHFI